MHARMVPESIAHYRISSKLGEGAMGEVYRATDSKLGREVAIKLIPEDFAKDSTRMSRFTREAQVLASLNHPNIAAIYGVEDRALIMELVEGPTLAERIKQGPIPLDEALEFARQIADGLAAAHDKGIVHRDLKPANIKITPSGTIKLLDFGLAKSDGPWTTATPADEAPTLTVASTGGGVILGTAAYMPPEQARGRAVDRRADIWAFGVILYEMLTGTQTFAGDTVSDVLASVIRQDPDLSRVPAKVRPLLRRCLEKDPKKRLRDAGDAMLMLEPVAGDGVAEAPSRGGLLWGLAGIAAVLLLALSWLAWVHFRETPASAEVLRFQMALPDNVRFTQSGPITISPDGRKVAFAAYGDDGNPRVWIRSLDSPTPQPLQEAGINQQVLPFFWSPDSRFVAFQQGGRLKKIDSEGGSPQVLVEDSYQFLGGTWNRDNVILFGTPQGILRVSGDGGKAAAVTAVSKGEIGHSYPVFLPDGRHFLYLRGSQVGDRYVAVGDLDVAPTAQSTSPLLKTDFHVEVVSDRSGGSPKILYLRDTTLVAQDLDVNTVALTGSAATVAEQIETLPARGLGYFSASENGTLIYRIVAGNNRQLTWLNRQGTTVGTPGERAPYTFVKVSPEGNRAAVVRVDTRQQPPNSDIWIVDLVGGGSTRLTFDPGVDTQPVWSPDGKWIAWQAIRGKEFGLFRKAADGSGTEEQLTTSPMLQNLSDWTHNGFLVYASMNDVWALPVDADAQGKRTPVAVVHSAANEFAAYVSPDDRWIVYIATDEANPQGAIFVQPFTPHSGNITGKWQVSPSGLGMARWRSDSRELIFVDGSGEIVAVNVAPGASFQASAPQKLFQFPLELLALTPTRGTVADATRDNQRFLFIMPVQETAQREISVFMNWQNALRK
ncbi:MAG TPA: protein kinase [Vicinamibacterales bacterium]